MSADKQHQHHPGRSPTVSFLSPPHPPRSAGSYHDAPGSIGSGGGSGRRISSTAMLASGGSHASIRSSSGRHRSSTRSAVSIVSSANSAFTPRKLDSGTPGSISSIGSISGGGGGGGGGSGHHHRPRAGGGTILRDGGAISSLTKATNDGSATKYNTNNNTNIGSTFSAVATPTSMMLVPPSQTISESLASLANDTATQLEQVWDEVGYSPEDRAAQLSDLLGSFRRVCDDKIAEERGVAVTFRKEIEAAREDIVATSRALRVAVDPTLLGNDGDNNGGNNGNDGSLTLTDELAAMEVTLEELRSSAATAKADLTECKNKMLQAHGALGTELEEEWKDLSTDLTQERRDAFHERVLQMEQEVSLRTSTTVGLLKDCQHLIRELRVDPAQSHLDRQIMGSLARDAVTDEIVMTSTNESDDCTGISARALADLTERVAELNGEKRRRKARLGEMGAEIATLWEKLHVPESEQRAFAESVKGLGVDTIQKGEDELRRLLDLKADMMGRLIDEAREEIERLWDETSANASQRAGFKAFSVTDESQYTDELLSEHDAYIQYLHRRYEQMQPILKVIQKREEIVKERMEYEELQKDPTRLQQRGSALTKQLMREEKIARRIKRDLPKATDYLERKLRDWKKTNDEPFVYQGEVYLDVMRRQEEEWNEYKDQEMQLKLRKRQEEKAAASNRVSKDTGYYKPLPGKKRSGAGANSGGIGGGGLNNPLADAGNRTNRARGPSRAKSRGRANNGLDATKPGLSGARSNNERAKTRSRPVSRGRLGMGASSMR